MDRDTFINLPLKLALGVIWDVASQRLRDMPAPEVPRPPRYDGRLGRRGGYVWMSELTLESLTWWHQKKAESAAARTEWSDKDGKTAATLAKWIEWRAISPNEVWSGTRGEDRATAAPPSREPKLNAWDNSKTNGTRQQGAAKDEDYGEDYE